MKRRRLMFKKKTLCSNIFSIDTCEKDSECGDGKYCCETKVCKVLPACDGIKDCPEDLVCNKDNLCQRDGSYGAGRWIFRDYRNVEDVEIRENLDPK